MASKTSLSARAVTPIFPSNVATTSSPSRSIDRFPSPARTIFSISEARENGGTCLGRSALARLAGNAHGRWLCEGAASGDRQGLLRAGEQAVGARSRLLFALVAAACLLFGCNSEPEWHAVDISGS